MNRQKIFILWMALTVALGSAAAVAAETFVFGIEDLPLMQGLTQISQDSVLFDTPQGRIVQASAAGQVTQVTQGSVVAFYDETLPQLGWTRIGEALYQREGEQLRLEFSVMDGQLFVTFLAEPSSN